MDRSVQFFDTQFERQVEARDLKLNPFEQLALPWLTGDVLDFGCGLGNLAVAAAQRGCRVLALDASPTAVRHLAQEAARRGLPIEAACADLKDYRIERDFDAVVAIGLLMFFDRNAAWRQLAQLQSRVRVGGVAVVNVLIEGTTFMDMFDPASHHLFNADALRRAFDGWDILHESADDFDAPGATRKAFITIMAKNGAQPDSRPAS